MRLEATVLSLHSDLAPLLPVGLMTERLPMPGAAINEVSPEYCLWLVWPLNHYHQPRTLYSEALLPPAGVIRVL